MDSIALRVALLILHLLANAVIIAVITNYDISASWLSFILFILVALLLMLFFIFHIATFVKFIKNQTLK